MRLSIPNVIAKLVTGGVRGVYGKLMVVGIGPLLNRSVCRLIKRGERLNSLRRSWIRDRVRQTEGNVLIVNVNQSLTKVVIVDTGSSTNRCFMIRGVDKRKRGATLFFCFGYKPGCCRTCQPARRSDQARKQFPSEHRIPAPCTMVRCRGSA